MGVKRSGNARLQGKQKGCPGCRWVDRTAMELPIACRTAPPRFAIAPLHCWQARGGSQKASPAAPPTLSKHFAQLQASMHCSDCCTRQPLCGKAIECCALQLPCGG